jgi:hypothetical protein
LDPRLLNFRRSNTANLINYRLLSTDDQQDQQPLLARVQERMSELFYMDADSHDIVKNKDFTGYCAIVVGANRGLGVEICRTLAFANCHVIMACRNLQSGDSALKMILEEKVINSILSRSNFEIHAFESFHFVF